MVYNSSIYSLTKTEASLQRASQLSNITDSGVENLPKACRTISKSNHREFENPTTNAVIALAIETASEGYGALVFCGSRMGAEKMAILIANTMPSNMRTMDTIGKRQDVLASLRALPAGYESA